MTINNIVNTNNDVLSQDMYEEYIIESIQLAGSDWYYLPRTMVDEDKLLREDVHSSFNNAYQIEGYITEENAFLNTRPTIGREGLEIIDGANLAIAKSRFHEIVPDVVRPFEGDLVYSSVYNGIFEIRHVEHEKPFFEFSDLTLYHLKIVKYQYNHDTFDTDIDEIDEIQYNYAYSVNLSYNNLIGSFSVGDIVIQDLSNGITVSGKISNIDEIDNIITLVDITSNDELQNNFGISSTSLLYNDAGSTLEITKLYDIDETLTEEESERVMPHEPVQQNQDFEIDVNDYTSKSNNPFWGS